MSPVCACASVWLCGFLHVSQDVGSLSTCLHWHISQFLSGYLFLSQPQGLLPAGSSEATPPLQHHVFVQHKSVSSSDSVFFFCFAFHMVCEKSQEKGVGIHNFTYNDSSHGCLVWMTSDSTSAQNCLGFLEMRLQGPAGWNIMDLMVIRTKDGNVISVCCLFLMIYCGKPHKPQRDVATWKQPHGRNEGIQSCVLLIFLFPVIPILSSGAPSEGGEDTTAPSNR